MKSIVILGGGITGLVSAYYLSKNFKVYILEKEKDFGGMSTSFKHNDLISDYGPHKLYTQLPKVMSEIAKVTPLLRIKKKNSLYLLDNYFDFPLSLKQIATKMPSKAFSVSLEVFTKNINMLPDDSYENYLINRFGKTLYSLVFKSYAEKIWGSAKTLDIELAKRRVAVSSIFELAKSVLMKDTKKISADYFFYPVLGSKQLIDNLILEIKKNKGVIIPNAKIQEIKLAKNRVSYVKANNLKIKADFLISTIYLDNLLSYLKADKKVTDASGKLSYVDLNIIYFVLDRKVIKDNWIFFPEGKFLFNRISEQNSFSPYINSTSNILMVETVKYLNEKTINKIKQQLVDLKIIQPSFIKEIFTRKLTRAYPLYKKGYKKPLNFVLNYLENLDNLYLVGRQGLFNYNNLDQCWDMAMKLSEHLNSSKTKQNWKPMLKYFDSYKIVD